jgi:hypothetical protein
MDFLTLLAMIGPALLVTGIVFVWLGLRARLIGAARLCAACGADQRVDGPDATSPCGRCGADLTAQNALRPGPRRRQPNLVILGLVFLGLAAYAIQRETWSYLQEVAYDKLLPDRVILWIADAENANGWVGRQVRQRIHYRAFDADDVRPLIDQLLVYQADRVKPWDHAIAAIISAARRRDLVDDVHWRRYIGQALQLRLVLPDRPVAPDEPVRFAVDLADRRAAEEIVIEPRLGLTVRATIGRHTMELPSNALDVERRPYVIDRASIPDLSAGVHELSVVLPVVFRHWGSADSAYDAIDADRADVALSGRIELADSARAPSVVAPSQSAFSTDPRRYGVVQLRSPNAPVSIEFPLFGGQDVCHQVILRDHGTEWPVGWVIADARCQPHVTSLSLWGPSLDGDVDVILRPDPERARMEPEIDALDPAEIRIEHVRAQRPTARLPPGPVLDGDAAGHVELNPQLVWRSPLWVNVYNPLNERFFRYSDQDTGHRTFVAQLREAVAGASADRRVIVAGRISADGARYTDWFEVVGWRDDVIDGRLIRQTPLGQKSGRVQARENVVQAYAVVSATRLLDLKVRLIAPITVPALPAFLTNLSSTSDAIESAPALQTRVAGRDDLGVTD